MDRRSFLKRIAAAGLVTATPELIVPERRFWQLDQTMGQGARIKSIALDEAAFLDDEFMAWWRSALEPQSTPMLDLLSNYVLVNGDRYAWGVAPS